MKGGSCPESITSSPYRERLGEGGCLFCLFSLRQRKRGRKTYGFRFQNLCFQAPKPMVLEGKMTCFEGHNPTIWYSATYEPLANEYKNNNGYNHFDCSRCYSSVLLTLSLSKVYIYHKIRFWNCTILSSSILPLSMI